jgi:hypothetical protein
MTCSSSGVESDGFSHVGLTVFFCLENVLSLVCLESSIVVDSTVKFPVFLRNRSSTNVLNIGAGACHEKYCAI